MAMKKSICRTLTHIDVAARSSVQLQAPITKTFSTTTPVLDSYPFSLSQSLLGATAFVKTLRSPDAFLMRAGPPWMLRI
jgi:hypothetical protein